MCHHPNNNTEKKFTNKSQHFKLKFVWSRGLVCVYCKIISGRRRHRSSGGGEDTEIALIIWLKMMQSCCLVLGDKWQTSVV